MAAPLSDELAAQRGAKTLPVRKGDTVRIMRGDSKGFEGKVSRVDLKEYRIYMEGLTREKVDGTNIFLAIHPSKVQIRNLNLDDKYRKDLLGRKTAPEKKQKPKATVKKAVKAEKAPAKSKAAIEEEKEIEKAFEEAPKVEETQKVAAKPAVKKAPAKKAVAKETAAKETEEKASEEGGE
jgi:large subunit ribosomal protein L24